MTRISIFIGTIKGAFVLRSDEQRRNWSVEGPLVKGWKATAIGRAPSGDYILGTSSVVYGTALHRSRDLVEWTPLEAPPAYSPKSGFKLNQVWTLATAGERMLCGVDEAGVFESRDDGTTWQLVDGLSSLPSRHKWFPGFGGMCAHSVLSANGGERLWVGISAVGVFRSDDGGRTWSSKNAGVPKVIPDEQYDDIGFCVHALAHDPDDPDTIWRQDHKGMFRSRDGGESWDSIETGLPSGFGFPLVRDRNTKTLYSFPLESDEYRLPMEGRVRIYRSRDDGDSWEATCAGLPQEHAYEGCLRSAMALDHLDPPGVYVGTTASHVYASADGGDSWTQQPCVLPRILAVEAFVEG